MAEDKDRDLVFGYLEKRFGIDKSLFKGYLLLKRKRSWNLLKNDKALVSAYRLKAGKVGIRAFRKIGAYIKPTTRMIQLFGPYATKARMSVDITDLIRLQRGESLKTDFDFEMGYVILTLGRGNVLGLGFLSDGMVRSQISRRDLRDSILSSPVNL